MPDVTRTCNQSTVAGSGLDPSKHLRRASGLLELIAGPEWPIRADFDGRLIGGHPVSLVVGLATPPATQRLY